MLHQTEHPCLAISRPPEENKCFFLLWTPWAFIKTMTVALPVQASNHHHAYFSPSLPVSLLPMPGVGGGEALRTRTNPSKADTPPRHMMDLIFPTLGSTHSLPGLWPHTLSSNNGSLVKQN